MFKAIIVAFDGSDHSEVAVRIACDLAAKYDSALHVVHVPELHDQAIAMGSAYVTIPVSEEALQKNGAVVVERAERIAQDAGHPLASSEILHGPPAEAILSCAADKGADLIVSGRRGLSKLGGLVMGSVSQRLAGLADCAVLTVK